MDTDNDFKGCRQKVICSAFKNPELASELENSFGYQIRSHAG